MRWLPPPPPRHPPRLPCLLVAEFKVAPSHAMSIHPPPPRSLPPLPTHTHTHTVRLQPSQPAPRQRLEWGTGGNALCCRGTSWIFQFYLAYTWQVYYQVCLLGPPPSSCWRLYLSLGHFISFDTFSVNFFCRHSHCCIALRSVSPRLASPRCCCHNALATSGNTFA